MRLDSYDVKILQILSHRGRITKSKLAEEICLSISPCWERVKRLENSGIIQGYAAQINTDILDSKISILVEVELGSHSADAFLQFEKAMEITPEVNECYAVGGQLDYILKIVIKDIDDYQSLIDKWLAADLKIERYFTYIVTKKVKAQPPFSQVSLKE